MSGGRTFEHVFALFLEDACPAFEILAPQEVRYGKSLRFRRAWLDWLLLLILLPRRLLGGLLLLLLLHLVLTHRLRLELLHVLLYRHSVSLRFCRELRLHLA